jgi:predicted anti-sigma-YlaC factor YlaD
MMSCHDVRRSVERFLALELDAGTETAMRAHLAACAACRAVVEEREPAMLLALEVGAQDEAADPSFATEVLGGIHQRRAEGGLRVRRRRWLAVAAAAAMVLGGAAIMRWGPSPAPTPVLISSPPPVARVEQAFVEVDGEGVRVYQVVPSPRDVVQVAFIVDPRLEL